MNEDKAARYHRLHRRAALLETTLAAVLLAGLLLSGAALQLRELASLIGMAVGNGYEEPVTALAMGALVTVLLAALTLPLAVYQGFTLEHRYGVSNESRRAWWRNHLKSFALTLLFSSASAMVVYWTMRAWPGGWWLLTAGAAVALMVAIVYLAPVLLLPLFYTFRPLDRPALVTRLIALAAAANTRINGVFEWMLSAQSKKANAALAGVGSTRRILLSDTLLTDYSEDEITVVLAHELAHHLHHDLWRALATHALLLTVTLAVMDSALRTWADPLRLRGIDDPAGWPLLLLVGGACTLAGAPLLNALSRAHERRADRYALQATGQPEVFISAMKRLAQSNLAEENPSRLVRWLLLSHPPVSERVAAARAFEQRSRTEGEARSDTLAAHPTT